ncbi:hypothetical protein SCLCIDRAFT_934647 [Scleroderma citrinum Foug A]|uniref:Uncharacterized protein n=1 Tax=Scleroderma citrinum Foug A TaxID=1036808 RepID=A0A0C3DXT1_9AGAM|nr:hypothetical protein SCLCIDRAFT_934647 [Scleroderma citrinum Foug A]
MGVHFWLISVLPSSSTHLLVWTLKVAEVEPYIEWPQNTLAYYGTTLQLPKEMPGLQLLRRTSGLLESRSCRHSPTHLSHAKGPPLAICRGHLLPFDGRMDPLKPPRIPDILAKILCTDDVMTIIGSNEQH